MFIPISDPTPDELISAIIRNPLTVTPNITVMEVIAQMSGVRTVCAVSQTTHSQEADLAIDARSSCVLVVENNEIIGIFTERDVIRLSAQKQNLENLAIGDVMSHPVVTLRESDFTDLFFAVNLLKQHHIRHLAVVDEQNQLRGLLTHESLRRQTRPVDLLRFRLVNEVMTTKVICAAADVSILDIARLMAENRISSVALNLLHQTNQNLENKVEERTQALQISEIKYRSLSDRLQLAVKSAQIGIWDWNIVNDSLVLDEQMYKLYGFKTSESVTALATWQRSLHPDDATNVNAVLQQAIRDEKDFDPEFRIVWTDATVRIIQAYAIVQRNSQGQAERMIGVNLDITERKQAEQKIKQQAEKEYLLNQTAKRIRESLDLLTIFNTATQEIQQVMNADRVGIFKFDPDSNFNDGEFVAESVTAGFKSVLEIKVHDHCFGDQYAAYYQQGKIQVVSDINNAGLKDCHRDVLAQFQIRANLIVPLIQEQHLWGLLCVHQCSQTRHWQEFEIELIQQLANQLAIAIQQSSLYKQLQSELIIRQQTENELSLQLQRLKITQEITQHIRSTLDLNQILATVTQQIKELMQVDRVIIFRVFPDCSSQIVEEAVSSGYAVLKNSHWQGKEERWSQDILQCYWQGKPRIIHDVMNDIWTDCLMEYSLAGQIQSKIVAPILQDIEENESSHWAGPDSKIWGLLVVHACATKRIWENNEAELLQQTANQLAIAVQQADIFSQLQASLAKEKEVSEMRSRFISMASHEFRTPLTIISSSTDILQNFSDRLTEDRKQGHLNTIQKSIKHTVQLLDDVLMINRAEADKMEFKPEILDIIAFCSSLKQEIQSTTDKHIIEFTVNSQNPILDNSLVVQFDPKNIRQILTNLLINAIKYSHENSLIDFSLTKENEQLIFKIQDSGIGIPEADIAYLFNSFHRASNVGSINGTGLGLAIVKKCVDLHKGEITVDSEVNNGTTFTVKIPIQD